MKWAADPCTLAGGAEIRDLVMLQGKGHTEIGSQKYHFAQKLNVFFTSIWH